MLKTILVPVVGTDIETPAFATAVSLARLFEGHVDCLYARPERSESQETPIRQAFLDTCRKRGIPTDSVDPAARQVTARWHRETGKVRDCVAEYARTSDLIVAQRGCEIAAAQALEAALFESGRPVLIPGSRLPSLETIAIAWKPTREAARAVSAAVPLLGNAKRVVLISISEDATVDRDDAERLATSLKRHHPNVETRFLRPGGLQVSEALLLHAYRSGAGLLVMGAYGRTRMRELILGGVTQNMLEASEVPVLLAH